jgi:ADP-ribose pyrophosphatase YjhB (NUDIX family)
MASDGSVRRSAIVDETDRNPYMPTLVSVSAAMILTRADGCVLLIRENYGARRWSLPGGVVEPGETPWEAAMREAREEVGVEVTIRHLAAVCFVRHRPERADALAFGFTGEILRGQPAVADPNEIAEIAWVRPENWPAPCTRSGPILVAEAVGGARGAFRIAE